MISNSVPWKSELFDTAARLEQRTAEGWSEESAFLVERDVMVGCYAVRKLLDTRGKISDEARSTKLSVTQFPIRDRAPDFWDAYDFGEYYDLDEGISASISLREMCNQVIHSLIFGMGVTDDGGGMSGIFVASDRDSRKRLLYAELDEVVSAFRIIAHDDVVSLKMRRDEHGVMHVEEASSLRSPDQSQYLNLQDGSDAPHH